MRKFLTRGLCVAMVVALTGFTTAACTVKVTTGKKTKPAPPPPAPKPKPKKAAPKPKPKKKKAKKIKFQMNKEGGVKLPGPVLFDTGTANLRPESEKALSVVVAYLKAKPEVTKMRIEGHTDSDGGNLQNKTLSKNRAMAVSQWIVAQGIKCNRLVPVGFGEEKPLVKNEKSDVDKQQNRRVVFIPAEKNRKPIAGRPVDGGAPGEIAGDPCK